MNSPAASATPPTASATVIGADGNVRKVYRKVDVSVHAQQVLADLSPAP
jgi:peroxiredoxin